MLLGMATAGLAQIFGGVPPQDAQPTPWVGPGYGTQVYTIELKYLTPDEVIVILHDQKYKEFLPPGIIMTGVNGTQTLLVKTDSNSMMTVTRLISIFDVPQARYAATVTLVYTATADDIPTGPLPEAQFTALVKQWITTRQASVLVLPETPLRQVQTQLIPVPPFAPEIGLISLSSKAKNRSDTKDFSFELSFFGPGTQLSKSANGMVRITSDKVVSMPINSIRPGEVTAQSLGKFSATSVLTAFVSVRELNSSAPAAGAVELTVEQTPSTKMPAANAAH
jgi:hypothetical protein